MLSYQHAFHAGNHADILKHYVLTFVLNSLNKKDKPYTMFDTHSGSGLYDLYDNRIIKTGEAEKGIQGLFNVLNCGKSTPPRELASYLGFIKHYVDKNLYPGSPEIERSFLRQQDSLVLSELHPQEIENLKANMAGASVCDAGSNCFPKIKIHNRNGWEMIKALTPPVTKRGAVLIDPSYEETQDYTDAARVIVEVNKKWSNGIIMLWYPLLSHREHEIDFMVSSIINGAKKVNANTEISDLRLEVYPKDKEGMPRLYGSGMLVLNSPWKLEEEGTVVVNYLKDVLAPLFE